MKKIIGRIYLWWYLATLGIFSLVYLNLGVVMPLIPIIFLVNLVLTTQRENVSLVVSYISRKENIQRYLLFLFAPITFPIELLFISKREKEEYRNSLCYSGRNTNYSPIHAVILLFSVILLFFFSHSENINILSVTVVYMFLVFFNVLALGDPIYENIVTWSHMHKKWISILLEVTLFIWIPLAYFIEVFKKER